MKKILFLNSHPIQYFTPLYQYIHKEQLFDQEVLFCSKETMNGLEDREFGVHVKWDIPILEGYKYKFLKNDSWKPSLYNGFFGLINLGIISYLFKSKKSVLIVHGWNFCTNILAIIAGKMAGHTVCLRGETPYNQEEGKLGFFKRARLRFIFLFIDKFLYIGEQNKLFYEALHVARRKLVFTPYAVDNTRFNEMAAAWSKDEARELLHIPSGKTIILYTAKYIAKKRPLDLIKAFSRIKSKNAFLVMVGEGALRKEIENFIDDNGLTGSVLLTGFVNQSDLPMYYKAADIFVMCSGEGETWGLAVNEAMSAGLPVIVSETTGCSYDLVEEGKNGFVFETGNIDALASKLTILINDLSLRNAMAKRSGEIINNFSYEKIIEGLATIK